MVVFPNSKINLGLHIIRTRQDGYHDLETVFYPLMIKDVLEVIGNTGDGMRDTGYGMRDAGCGMVEFSASGLQVEGSIDNNLCLKAYHLLKKDFPSLPSIKMHLHKAIPMGAGLGGGSSDAAFTLQLLNEKFQLGIGDDCLLEYALQLGSDCPFFIRNKPCFATGRGEQMENITLDLSSYQFFIVHPGIHISTGWAFSQIHPSIPKKSIKSIIQQPISTWKEELKNDFENAVIQQYPAISDIKKQLYQAGALYASMTGSGSTVYGIFEKNASPALSFPSTYYTQIA